MIFVFIFFQIDVDFFMLCLSAYTAVWACPTGEAKRSNGSGVTRVDIASHHARLTQRQAANLKMEEEIERMEQRLAAIKAAKGTFWRSRWTYCKYLTSLISFKKKFSRKLRHFFQKNYSTVIQNVVENECFNVKKNGGKNKTLHYSERVWVVCLLHSAFFLQTTEKLLWGFRRFLGLTAIPKKGIPVVDWFGEKGCEQPLLCGSREPGISTRVFHWGHGEDGFGVGVAVVAWMASVWEGLGLSCEKRIMDAKKGEIEITTEFLASFISIISWMKKCLSESVWAMDEIKEEHRQPVGSAAAVDGGRVGARAHSLKYRNEKNVGKMINQDMGEHLLTQFT